MLENVGELCAGCTACKNCCPQQCITMKYNDDGFSYPAVDEKKCTSCGRCENVCPVLNLRTQEEYQRKAFYGWHKDSEIRRLSSSGGAFSALAQTVLEKNGVVFGAVFDHNKCEIIHSGTRESTLDNIRRSKYVESNPDKSFTEVKQLLESGVLVLYCSTPCQIAGIRNFLGKEYDNLILVDFICGGAASKKCFQDYIHSLEKKYRAKAADVNFRSKQNGWTNLTIEATFANGNVYKSNWSYDPFYLYNMQYKLLNRKSCYACRFGLNHVSDITIADFWGHKAVGNIVNDDKGLSMIIVNSVKGEQVLDKINPCFNINPLDMKYTEYTLKEHTKNEERLNRRNEFFDSVNQWGFEKAFRKTYKKYTGKPIWVYRGKKIFKMLLQK